MIKHIYVKRDKKMKFFECPQFSDLSPEQFKVATRRSVGYCQDKRQLTILNDCELIYLGCFNDENGEFKLESTKLFDFSDFINL